MSENQDNSFPYVKCGTIETEESGATEGFTCEQCIIRSDDDCSHVFHNMHYVKPTEIEVLILYCEICDQWRKEVFNVRSSELIECTIF